MADEAEVGQFGDSMRDLIEPFLVLDRKVHVAHRATLGADHMVVVPGQPLGQLEPSDAIGAVMTGEDPGFCQNREAPVQRRDGNLFAKVVVEVGSGQRSWTRLERCHHLPSGPGEAHPRRLEVLGNLFPGSHVRQDGSLCR